MNLHIAASFDRALRKLDKNVQGQVRAAVLSLHEVPMPGKLHFKPLKASIYWSARVDGSYRLIFTKSDAGYRLIDVCNHKVYERLYAK